MKISQPFHQGEISVQTELNERDVAIGNGRLYQDVVMVPARVFLTQQAFLVLGCDSGNGGIWTSLVFGLPGFMGLEDDGKTLTASLSLHRNIEQDPVLRSLVAGAKVGCLVIDFSTRRRLRINGVIKAKSDTQLVITVEESYPNCPKYIQKRTIDLRASEGAFTAVHEHGEMLHPDHIASIQRADTFFVTTSNTHEDVGFAGNTDTSHRGGLPGFVKVLDDRRLRIPDYPGNSLYNTFGNLRVNPQAGLLFWNFDASELLHLRGYAELDFRPGDGLGAEAAQTGGTNRWWMFTPTHWERQRVHLPFQLQFLESSPANPEIQV